MFWRVVRASAVVLALCQCPCLRFAAGAATIRVTGDCTLVDALVAANTDSPSGDCPAGSGRDDVVLTSGWVLDSVYEFATGANGLPVIDSEIYLHGNGFAITRAAGAPNFRFFEVAPAGTLWLFDLWLFGGSSESLGGAIYNEGETGIIESTLFLNTSSGSGGGVHNVGDFFLFWSTVSGNATAVDGGGVHNSGSSWLYYSLIKSNDATQGGGGVKASTGGFTHIFETVISDNEAANGGGVLNAGSMAIWRSLVATNEASGLGGGLRNIQGDLFLHNSTVSGNTADQAGGLSSKATTTISLTTLVGNRATGPHAVLLGSIHLEAGTIELEATISKVPAGQAHCNSIGIYDDGANFGCHGVEVTGLDLTLRDNGGRTMTHAITEHSNAVDAAGDCSPTDRDQRGAERPGDCDSGSYEWGRCGDAVLRDRDVTSLEHLTACEYFWLGPDVEVTGRLLLTAGYEVIIRDGFSVGPGGELTVQLNPSLPP